MIQADENLIELIAQAAAAKLTPQEAHAIGVSLVIRFGGGCEEARTYAQHVNATGEKLGLPRITQAVAGNPSAKEKQELFRSAIEKLDDKTVCYKDVKDKPTFDKVAPTLARFLEGCDFAGYNVLHMICRCLKLSYGAWAYLST